MDGLGSHQGGAFSLISHQDISFIIGLSLAYPLLRYILTTAVFERIARRSVTNGALRAAEALPDKINKKVGKFNESLWKLMVYCAFVTLGLRAVFNEPWVTNCSEFWTDYPEQPHSAALLQYYWMEMAFYISSQFMLLCWETRRSDFYAMFIHHCATNSLIMFSYYRSCLRIGAMIMLLHDISDVFLEGAKLCNYSRKEKAADCLFGVFMLSWALLRLCYFPFTIVMHVIKESSVFLGDLGSYYGFVGLLCTLVVLHVYWFWLILRVAANKVITGKVDDVREEDD